MTTYDPNIQAKMVKLWYTGVTIPEAMGKPRPDQMQGTHNEQLCEAAGRVCYDSMGSPNSRDSFGYHKHISEVKHFSTIEHATFTVQIKASEMSAVDSGHTIKLVMLALQNRPQLLINYREFQDSVRVTLDLRHIVEWDIHTELSDTCRNSPQTRSMAQAIKKHLMVALQEQCPTIMSFVQADPANAMYDQIVVKEVTPETDSERFVTVFMAGGRGFSHEQVRHRFNMSQRSSRFCDEADSPIIEHPLISEFLADEKIDGMHRDAMKNSRANLHQAGRDLYRAGVKSLQSWLELRGIKGTDARKQARGAMRNDLGNGLYTEIIFTASLTNWRHMFRMRSSQFADAEIRQVYCKLLPEFQKFGHFTEWTMKPAPDGLGHCVVM